MDNVISFLIKVMVNLVSYLIQKKISWRLNFFLLFSIYNWDEELFLDNSFYCVKKKIIKII